jgi:hypothetical protein
MGCVAPEEEEEDKAGNRHTVFENWTLRKIF